MEGTHEEIVCVRIGSANSKQLHQVVKLPVDITADGDRTFLTSRWSANSASLAVDIMFDLPRAVHSTPLAAPPEPNVPHKSAFRPRASESMTLEAHVLGCPRAYSFAKPLYIALRQGLAVHQALDPTVQSRDGGRLMQRCQVNVRLHILHVGIHYRVHPTYQRCDADR